MIKIPDFSQKKLNNLAPDCIVLNQIFSYADIEGVADLISWKIVFFKKKRTGIISAICFQEIFDDDIIKISNSILKKLNIDIKFGETIKDISMYLGNSYFVDKIYYNMIRYGALLSSSVFVSIGLTEGKVSYFEVVTDKEIIDNIISARNCN